MPSPQLDLRQFLTNPDNTHIRYGIYGTPKRSHHLLLFILGRGEWIEKYLPLYEQLHRKLSRTLVIVDHVGQGGSGGIPAHVDRYDEYVDPITQLLANEFSHRPYDIIAHSMGGLVALYGTLLDRLHPQRLVLSAPLIGLPQKPMPRLLSRPLSQQLSSMGLGHTRTLVKSEISYSFKKNRLTSDREKYQQLQKTPYPIPSPTMGWVHATFLACDTIHYDYHLTRLQAPLLIFYGSCEHVVSAQSIKRWVKIARKLSNSTIELVHTPESRHEIFCEQEDLVSRALRKTVDFLSH